jgi:predicted DNA-binding antitoxin AbrB/MazE fold protein
MLIWVDAVYQNGILGPLQPLHLPENELVIVTIRHTANAPAFGLEELRRRVPQDPRL